MTSNVKKPKNRPVLSSLRSQFVTSKTKAGDSLEAPAGFLEVVTDSISSSPTAP